MWCLSCTSKWPCQKALDLERQKWEIFQQKARELMTRGYMGLSENRQVPLNPMVLLIIIPFLNGYFIGIPYFQTNPHQKPMINLQSDDVVESTLDLYWWLNPVKSNHVSMTTPIKKSCVSPPHIGDDAKCNGYCGYGLSLLDQIERSQSSLDRLCLLIPSNVLCTKSSRAALQSHPVPGPVDHPRLVSPFISLKLKAIAL